MIAANLRVTDHGVSNSKSKHDTLEVDHDISGVCYFKTTTCDAAGNLTRKTS